LIKKSIPVILLLTGLILYSFPNTYSVLLSTHNVKDISSPSNDVSCTKCHSKIANELSNSAYHKSLSCEDCHRNPYLGQEVAMDNGTATPGKEAHVAVKPRCLDCHSKTTITLANGTAKSVPKAKAFGDANYGSDYSAHKTFVITSNGYNLAVGENEACLACHADFKVRLTFRYPEYINVSIDINGTSPDGLLYNIISVSYGPDRTYTVTVGNGSLKHRLVPLSSIKCISCHKNIYLGGLGDSIGRQHAGDVTDKAGTDPAIHQTMPVNNDWCLYCHFNQSANLYPTVNAEFVHAAEKIRCVSCHNENGPYPPSNETFDHLNGHNSTYFYAQFWNIPISANGDICIVCHVSHTHTSSTLNTTGCACHSGGYYVNATIYREPKANETPGNWIFRVIQ